MGFAQRRRRRGTHFVAVKGSLQLHKVWSLKDQKQTKKIKS